jgi:hypothetical protein
MKYLKKFEIDSFNSRGRFADTYHWKDRDNKYRYLDEEKHHKLEKFVEDFIINKNYTKLINKLSIDDFQEVEFSYRYIWRELLFFKDKKYYEEEQFYYEVDKFCNRRNIGDTVEIRNSLFVIMNKLFDKYNIEEKLDKRLILILKKKPKLYIKIYYDFEGDLSKKVKDTLQWIIDDYELETKIMPKYNL